MTEVVPKFRIGEAVRCSGRYFMHWEVSRFDVRQPRRWFGSRVVHCELVDDTAGDTLLDRVGSRLPDKWRYHPGLVFDVTMDVTPVEHGRFGHRGMIEWRLRVDHWISVELRG
jgi:hypothetical protein